ncbi:MAG TPA: 4'-phosphopantetheinyl transferase superfamily protein [Gemmatimonadaceae bacterium]|nr:4'-phosphopantetheinyl transferase superfamily protein [Gemmatimonadaceae bacterium]
MSYRSENMERGSALAAVPVAVACEDGRGALAPGLLRRAEYVASRAAARRARAQIVGDGPAADVVLSLTHSQGRGAAVALPAVLGVRAGIDLEREGGLRAELARYFLTDAERRHVAEHARGLTELWTLKEAAWKALRLDDSVHFTALELRFDDAGEVDGLALHGVTMPARATLSRPWPGFVLAVVLVGAPA